MTLAQDYAELCNLYARYCHSIDACDEVAIRSCFAPDGTLEVVDGRLADGAATTVTIVGRDAITERMLRVSGGHPGFRHETFNVVLEPRPEGSSCVGRASFRVSTDRAQPESVGHYEDEVVREGSTGWAFSRRMVVYAWRDTW